MVGCVGGVVGSGRGGGGGMGGGVNKSVKSNGVLVVWLGWIEIGIGGGGVWGWVGYGGGMYVGGEGVWVLRRWGGGVFYGGEIFGGG
uniref:Uncharacterized protein n=1 Tax=Knipowitschia caucasica TaxID=637954 RepID=A0AAV2KTN9_KNICA